MGNVIVGKTLERRAKEAFGQVSESVVCFLETSYTKQEYGARVAALFSPPIAQLYARLRPEEGSFTGRHAGSIICDAVDLASYDLRMFNGAMKLVEKILDKKSRYKEKEEAASVALYHLTLIKGSIKFLGKEREKTTMPAFWAALQGMEAALESGTRRGLVPFMNEIGYVYDRSWREYRRGLMRPFGNLTAAVMEQTGMQVEDAELEAWIHMLQNGRELDIPSTARNVRFLNEVSRLGPRMRTDG